MNVSKGTERINLIGSGGGKKNIHCVLTMSYAFIKIPDDIQRLSFTRNTDAYFKSRSRFMTGEK